MEADYAFQSCDMISGDFVIMEMLDENRLGILVIDVMGHGLKAGLETVEVKTIFESEGKKFRKPSEFLRTLNARAICARENQFFMTGTYVILDLSTSLCLMSSSGGLPLLLRRSEGDNVELHRLVGDPIGLYGNDEYFIDEIEISLGEGDMLLLQTDGIVESHSPQNEQFDSPYSLERVIKVLREHESPSSFIKTLTEMAQQHVGEHAGFDDDITLVAVKVKGATGDRLPLS